MDLSHRKHLRLCGLHWSSLACKCVFLVVIVLVFIAVCLDRFSGFGSIEKGYFFAVKTRPWTSNPDSPKFLEVPQIIWGLNNQKIALARACLTARMLNRTLLMPSLSASLFYKEVNLLKPVSFDKIFQFDKFNSLCKGFVQLSRYPDVINTTDLVELKKGSGRRWTIENDLHQLKRFSLHPYYGYKTIRIVGKSPFLWHDHWPVKDYAKVFECLVLGENISREADKVVSKIREMGLKVSKEIGSSQINGPNPMSQPLPYAAVHMRIEKDWMIHCKKLEQRLNISEICSSKDQIIQRVGNIEGLKTPMIVYLAVADDLLEDDSIMAGWKEGLLPFEKKKLGVLDVYKKHPYLIQSAIDYEVCLRSDVFVGNSFSTFSSLVVLDRSQKMINMGVKRPCGMTIRWPSYAYNLQDKSKSPRPWATNMYESSLQAISYGSNHISCS